MSLGLRTGRLSASSAPRARARAPLPWCSIENRLFNRTVRENIALRDPALPMELAYLRIWGQHSYLGSELALCHSSIHRRAALSAGL